MSIDLNEEGFITNKDGEIIPYYLHNKKGDLNVDNKSIRSWLIKEFSCESRLVKKQQIVKMFEKRFNEEEVFFKKININDINTGLINENRKKNLIVRYVNDHGFYTYLTISYIDIDECVQKARAVSKISDYGTVSKISDYGAKNAYIKLFNLNEKSDKYNCNILIAKYKSLKEIKTFNDKANLNNDKTNSNNDKKV